MTSSREFRLVADVRNFIAGDEGLTRLEAEVTARTDDDPAHDAAHFHRVALWTVRIGGDAVDRRSAVAAALLHDVVNVPKNSPLRAEASRLSSELAAELLPAAGFSGGAVSDIVDAIRTHSFSRGEAPRSPLGDALQDADRLEALGALGIFRCIATGARLGAKFFDASDPWAFGRPLDDARFSIDHFFVKLLKLPATMRTAAGRSEAERRAGLLRATVRSLGDELGIPPPESLASP